MIGSTTNQAAYAGNASTSTAYVIPFRYDASSWVHVTVTNALGEITDLEQVTDYVLAGTGSTANGTFTTVEAVPATSTVTVYRETPGTQTLSLPANTPLPAVSVEAALDRLAMAAADSVTQRALAARLSALLIDAGVNITVQDLLDLLQSETLVATGVSLPDTSGVSLEVPDGSIGVLGLDASGRIVIHKDGSPVGGDLYIPLDPWLAKGTKVITSGMMASALFSNLHSFPLTSAQAAVGKRYRLSGTYELNFLGTRPATAFFGVTTDDTLALADVTILYGAEHSGSTLKVVKAAICWEFTLADNSGGDFIIEAYTHGASEATLTGSTTAIAQKDSAYTLSSETGTAGLAQNLKLVLQTPATASAGSAYVTWDLKLEATN